MRRKETLYWIALFLFFLLFLQRFCAYDFYSFEQAQLFLYDGDYINGVLSRPGGFARIASEYLVQFFIIPWAGPLIMGFIFVLIAMVVHLILKRISPTFSWLIASALPSFMILFIFFNFNYQNSGTISFLLFVVAFRIMLMVNNSYWRLSGAFIISFLLFVLAAPVHLLFSISWILYELWRRESARFCLCLFLLPFSSFLSWFTIHTGWIGEYRLAFLPDAWFHPMLTPSSVIYFSWIIFLILLLLALFLSCRMKVTLKQYLSFIGLQFLVVCCVGYWGTLNYLDTRSIDMKKLDYYCRNQYWDRIISVSDKPVSNWLYMACLNMALAEKGQLAEKIFSYSQSGPNGLIVPFNRSVLVSTLLSDIYFVIGDIASSQRMAFEANVSNINGNNPRMLKRLVETNLIYGAYPVAEKYISILEQTWFYKEWASKQRVFLYNDVAVENDPVLGKKRKGIPDENFILSMDGYEYDLVRYAEGYPANKNFVEYAGAILLLKKELPVFLQMIEKYYGTVILPDLPKSFQEAIIILNEGRPEEWERYEIEPSIIERFLEYKKQVINNKHNQAALPNLLRRSFGDTYWFYYMFSKGG